MLKFIKHKIDIAVKLLIFNQVKVFYPYFIRKTFEKIFFNDIAAWQPDVIHAHDGTSLPLAAKLASALDAKMIFDSHELEVHRNPPLPFLHKMIVEKDEKKYLPQAISIFTPAANAADYIAKEYGVKKPVVIYNSPTVEKTDVAARIDTPDRTAIRDDFILHPDAFLFVYTGNVGINRGLELAFIALSNILDYTDPNERFTEGYYLATVGNIDPRTEKILTALAKKYHIEDRIIFLPPVAPHRVYKYIESADAAIIPIFPATMSYEFAMPNKLFEATLAGLPILGADLLEMDAFIKDNDIGLTYTAGDVDHCTEKMVELINNYSKYNRSPQRQKELVEKYCWEKQGQKILDIYKKEIG